jgi:hypothetical protein
MTTPTKDCGKPTASTPASMAGDSTFASPTTAASETVNNARLIRVAAAEGGGACSSAAEASPSATTGRKKSRCRTVWVSTNMAYRTSEVTAAKASCEVENSGPGSLVVNVGNTSVSVASVTTVVSPPGQRHADDGDDRHEDGPREQRRTSLSSHAQNPDSPGQRDRCTPSLRRRPRSDQSGAAADDEADQGVLQGVGSGEGVGLVLVESVGAVLVDEAVEAVR